MQYLGLTPPEAAPCWSPVCLALEAHESDDREKHD